MRNLEGSAHLHRTSLRLDKFITSYLPNEKKRRMLQRSCIQNWVSPPCYSFRINHPLRSASRGEKRYFELLRYCLIYKESYIRSVMTGEVNLVSKTVNVAFRNG